MSNAEEHPMIVQNLRRLINLVDELRDIGLQQYINLPRICVVGTQSAGKSSVLEAIVGMNFLPRGDGIVTRRPLELRLIHETPSSNSPESWAVFESKVHQKFTDFSQVKRVIEELTDEVAGKNKGIVDDPIVLTVHSALCPDLTLIDLPGITRVPLKGSDQTDEIEKLTREMAMRYAQDVRTIILAVVPANMDMSTSDALQIARKVDPKGLRTIGVITKIDLMDKGTDASRMLLGEEVPLRLGYTGVRNRCQADIKNDLSIKEAIQEEKRFFRDHAVYRTLPPHILGTQALVDKLTRVLFRHIRAHLPEIKREINNRLRAVQLRLDELGTGVPVAAQEKIQLMWSMITDYCELFRNTIRGKFDKKVQIYFEHHEVTGGAQIRSIFNKLLEEFVESSPTEEMQDYDIDLAIRMHEGDALPGFPSSDTFEYLILPHFQKIQPPVMDCLDRVTQALESLSQTIVARVFNRFPKLSEEIMEKSSSIIYREKEVTKNILENVVAAEIGYLFTNNADYLTHHGSMLPMHVKASDQSSSHGLHPESMPAGDVPQSQTINTSHSTYTSFPMNAGKMVQTFVSNAWSGDTQEKKQTQYSSVFIREIRERLNAYFSIVLKNIRDVAPKIIGYFLVRRLQEKLQFELYNDLAKAEYMSALLAEPSHIIEERLSLESQIATLKKASFVLQRDPSTMASPLNEFDDAFDTELAQHLAGPEDTTHRPLPTQAQSTKPPPPPDHANSSVEYRRNQNAEFNAMRQLEPPPPPPSTTSTLWGLRSSAKSPTDRKNITLFGDRQPRNDINPTKCFTDTKIVNPLYS